MFCRPHLNMSMQPESASVSHTNAEGLGVAGRADNNLDNLQVVHVAQPLFGPEEKIAFSHVLDDGWGTMGSRVRAFELVSILENIALQANHKLYNPANSRGPRH